MAMLEHVSFTKRSMHSYRSFCDTRTWKSLKVHGDALKGVKVLHVNATPIGGGVAELLQAIVPLQRDLGIDANWVTIKAPADFFEITKELHNALQGKVFRLDKGQIARYKEINEELAESLSEIDYDLAVIHDPQPMAMIATYHQPPMILRIHPDASTPDRRLSRLFRPYFEAYEHLIFSHDSYIPRGIAKDRTSVMMPAIDPISQKNRAMDRKEARKMLSVFGIDANRPLIVQVSRFDSWKDPKGVIQAYRIAKKRFPDLQLVLMGILRAKDDPEAVRVFLDIQAYAGNDPDIHLLHHPEDLKGLDNEKVVNAVQSGADVMLQLSTREGFGLTATEAMWKGSALIGGPARGLRMQINHGKNGYIAKNPLIAGKYLIRLLADEDLRSKIGKEAQKRVRRDFLTPRLLLDHLRLYRQVLD